MNRTLRAVLAVVAGLVIGGIVNIGLVMASGRVVALPPGADLTTTEGLRAAIHLFQPRHFVYPFLAHGLGTFIGALVATMLAPRRTSGPAYVVGIAFLLGGIASTFALPAPLWFSAVDVAAAYLPAAWLAQHLASPRAGAAGRA